MQIAESKTISISATENVEIKEKPPVSSRIVVREIRTPISAGNYKTFWPNL